MARAGKAQICSFSRHCPSRGVSNLVASSIRLWRKKRGRAILRRHRGEKVHKMHLFWACKGIIIIITNFQIPVLSPLDGVWLHFVIFY